MVNLGTLKKDLNKRRKKAEQGGGEQAIAKQIAMGKLPARERINQLLDEGSFHEYDLFIAHDAREFGMDGKELPGDGVIIGTGTIHGRSVAIYAQDFTVAGGSLGSMHARKIVKMMDYALRMRMPLIGINDSGGARIQEGVNSLAGYGEIFFRNTLNSGVIPQISVILGPCAGGAVYSPALTDYVFVVENISKMFITGPEVIKSVLGEEISMEELGGARIHSEITGNAHFYALTEQECFEQIKTLLSYIPWSNNANSLIQVEAKEPNKKFNIEKIVPIDPTKPYDVRDVIRAITDGSEFFEVQERWAPNIVIGYGRMGGRTIGFIANQPLYMSGVLDINSSAKSSRVIRLCDVYNLPVLTFIDCPGYLPGTDQEYGGVIRHGAKIIYAYCESTVPKISIVTRKAIGGSYVALGSRQMRNDVAFAWPSAQIAVMGPEGAAPLVNGKAIKEAQAKSPEEGQAVLDQFVSDYRETFLNPYRAADIGQIDEVIEPRETRTRLIQMLNVLQTKVAGLPNKKHGVFPS
jgi:acetyl-CoA carboxylase carboxyltransferase component